jgi:hypothetical protein
MLPDSSIAGTGWTDLMTGSYSITDGANCNSQVSTFCGAINQAWQGESSTATISIKDPSGTTQQWDITGWFSAMADGGTGPFWSPNADHDSHTYGVPLLELIAPDGQIFLVWWELSIDGSDPLANFKINTPLRANQLPGDNDANGIIGMTNLYDNATKTWRNSATTPTAIGILVEATNGWFMDPPDPFPGQLNTVYRGWITDAGPICICY